MLTRVVLYATVAQHACELGGGFIAGLSNDTSLSFQVEVSDAPELPGHPTRADNVVAVGAQVCRVVHETYIGVANR